MMGVHEITEQTSANNVGQTNGGFIQYGRENPSIFQRDRMAEVTTMPTMHRYAHFSGSNNRLQVMLHSTFCDILLVKVIT